MKTLQEKYNAILEGNFSKTQFVRDARLAHSNLITQFNSFADTVAILKNKGMVVEAKKAEVTAYKKPEVDPIDMVAPDLLDHGIEAELHAAGITGTPSEEEYAKAKEKAAKELIKDPLCYKNAQTMTEPGEKMEKAKLNEGDTQNTFLGKTGRLRDELSRKKVAAVAAEKPFSVAMEFRDMVMKEPEKYTGKTDDEIREKLIAALEKFKLKEEANENEEEGSGYSYGEYKEGNGADAKEIQNNIDFYKKKPDVWSMVAKKDFEAMADGKSADIKDEHYPEWKKEDFVEVLNALEPVKITERLSPEVHTRMEGLVSIKAINTFIEAAGIIIKDLKQEDFEEDDIFEFLIDRLLTLESMSSADEIDKDEKQFRREQGLEEQETQLKEAVKTLIKKTLES